MVTKETFSSLYEEFAAWQVSQSGQTDGYEYERSFDEFVRQMNSRLFQMAVDEAAAEGSEPVEGSKKKSRRNMGS